jgi:hypothetical protein
MMTSTMSHLNPFVPLVLPLVNRASFVPRSTSTLDKVASIDFYKISYHKVQYLPPLFNGNVLFEVPASRVSTLLLRTAWMVWISGSMVTHGAVPLPPTSINIHGPTLRKFSCVGHLECNNQNCNFQSKSSKRNGTEWSSQTNNTPFILGQFPPLYSILVYRVYKTSPTCVNFCNALIYYFVGKIDMTRACIHLRMHNHLVFDGICRQILNTISDFIA